jgi:hypothetical protein
MRFDGHEFLYPEWQLARSPAEGDRGVLEHLDEVLAELSDAPQWERAKFFVTSYPVLGGRTPLDVLRGGTAAEMELVRRAAAQRAEMGS